MVEALIELIDMFRGERRYNKELMDAALAAISDAVVATRTYEARIKSENLNSVVPERRERTEEVRIGGLWQTAAIKTRNVSPQFANRLNEKALYWFLEFPWNAEEVVSKGIDWNSIDNTVHSLIKNGS